MLPLILPIATRMNNRREMNRTGRTGSKTNRMILDQLRIQRISLSPYFCMRWALVILVSSLLGMTAYCQDRCSCSGKYPVIASSFKVHGRLSIYNGSAVQRIWIIGTRRMLGIRDDTELPANLARLLGDFNTEVYGDFVVCPLTKFKTGSMQIVCVQSAYNLRSRKRN